MVHHHPSKPSPKRGIAAKLPNPAERGDKSLLRYLLSQFPAAADPHGNRKRGLLVLPVNPLARPDIAPPGTGECHFIDLDVESVLSHQFLGRWFIEKGRSKERDIFILVYS
jgi:hypothetical protein